MASDLPAFLAWYAAVAVAGLAALPLAFRLFQRLPDRGYGLARLLGLLLIGYAFWFLGSLGFLRNDNGGLVFAALLVGGLGWLWLGRAGWAELRAWLSAERATVLAVEALFLAAFALLAWVRAYQPDIHGTEKPMEYMFINSILRSPAFPAQDAWLSGHAISYYYFGYVIIAALARVTATDAAVAFNLGLALLFALTAVGAHSLVQNLIALTRRLKPADPLAGAFGPALLAPLFVLIVGNFYGVAQSAYVNGLFPEAKIWTVRYYFGADDPANPVWTDEERAALPPEVANPGLRAEWVNLWAWLDLKQVGLPAPERRPQFTWDVGGNWFYGARVVHDRSLTGGESEAIDENPAFSFILGDMHPHVLALPFSMLAAALALAWLLWGQDANAAAPDALELTPAALRRPAIFVTLLLAALILGGLSFLNTWDFPIYLFLTMAALAAGLGLRLGWAGLVAQAGRLAALAVGLAALSVALYFPFYLTFQSQAGGLLPNLIWPTRFQQTVVFFGPVLLGVAGYLAWLTARGRRLVDWRSGLWAGGGLVGVLVFAVAALAFLASRSPSLVGVVEGFLAPLSLDTALGLVIQRRLVDSLATLCPGALIVLAVGLLIGIARQPAPETAALPAPEAAPEVPEAAAPVEAEAAPAARPWRRRPANPFAPAPAVSVVELLRSPAVLMALVMALTGALLLLGPEWVYLRDNFGWRMNTIFKFYFQAWNLWALVTAFALWHTWQYFRVVVRWVVGAAAGLVVFGGLIYTLPSLYSYTGGFARAPSLDGMAWFANAYPDDWAGIQWLRANVSESPVVAEAVGGSYAIEESRMATGTGLPTVMGWVNHEGQWRGNYYAQVGGRVGDLAALYQSREWADAQAVLDKYNIEYVVVGAAEHRKYDVENQRVWQDKFERNMDNVFSSGSLTIYRRKPEAVP
ncbi:MAG: hypothetical protein IT317_12015 [Anaerolineales bacterium]|nr:hypothetical protein [Anaerolineales bacterium]